MSDLQDSPNGLQSAIAGLVPYVQHDDGCAAGTGARCSCGMTMRLEDMQRAVDRAVHNRGPDD